VTVTPNTAPFYKLGQANNKFDGWRPSGRLITTLYEHKTPVNTLAITDDSQYFITGSRLDNQINVWSTKEIEQDVTSHSFFSIKHKSQVNAITTLDNSYYFAVAGSGGCIDIYAMGRVEQE
jgi:WD40 repeat protein